MDKPLVRLNSDGAILTGKGSYSDLFGATTPPVGQNDGQSNGHSTLAITNGNNTNDNEQQPSQKTQEKAAKKSAAPSPQSTLRSPIAWGTAMLLTGFLLGRLSLQKK